MQKAEVARTPKALGQHMLENQPQELGAGQRSGLPLLWVLLSWNRNVT